MAFFVCSFAAQASILRKTLQGKRLATEDATASPKGAGRTKAGLVKRDTATPRKNLLEFRLSSVNSAGKVFAFRRGKASA
jgi:hypothetical protein